MIETGITPPPYRITPLQQIAKGGRWRTEAMRAYSQPVLYWFTRGQGRLTVQGVTHGYGAHNAVMLPAGTMHGFDTLGQVAGVVIFFPNDPELNLPDEPMHLRLRDGQAQAEMSHQVENIQRELDLGPDASERALNHHAGLLGVWLERQAGPDWRDALETGGGASQRLAAAFTSLLERDFRNGRNVADYAAQLGITPTHLSRACKAASGRPASALVQDRVHYEARKLLRETRMPVKDVAQALGFRSAAYFTRAFQQKTGMTPSAFRRGA
ncbi:helix-turn-helix domain-containing protein [Maribius pontilimi]|uniref:Helix-turn-helix domain-containing protein n=1 Tax=Palleronia pontilimi TaxID=1964209 RepID=A0A934I9C5_9RHOB|nr:AraC family transcriptional regulator [Palleronia pontilimi]MBJ3762879.1 helix-turn-helix domain-containing protein [Palleronia pontilimi]